MMKRLLLFAAAVIAGLGPTPARADDWESAGLDGTHARLSAERSGARFADGRWSVSFPGGARVLASPVVSDGVAVTIDLAGTIHAVGAADGRVLWQAAAGVDVQGTPAARHGHLFVPTLGNKVVAFHLVDGTALWTREVGGETLSAPTPVDDDVIVAVGFPHRRVVRLSGATGDVVWQTPDLLYQFSNTSPVVAAGLAIVGSNGGRYYAFDAATGALRWTYAGDGIVHLAAPVIAAGRVYMAGGGDSSRVHAVDAATGVSVAGWPIELPKLDPDVAGTVKGRQRAISSIASVGGLLLLETRLDDALDTDGDGVIDDTLSRETVFALDADSGAVVWQRSVARAEIKDRNDLPKFFVCPTPAAFGATAGAPLVAVASSLVPTISVLDATSGMEMARQAVSGPALASPVVANGRLFTTAISGVFEALLSSVNHPPAAPVLAANARPLENGDATLRWLPAADPDAELPGYELRIDADGEVLESWQQVLRLGAGVTSVRLTTTFAEGTTYTFAVRARDGQGAYSPWSDPQTFTVTTNPAVSVNGNPASSLGGALGVAGPGDVITLGPGRYSLTDTLHVRAGVSIRGAGAGQTVIDAGGLSTGVSFDGPAAAGQPSGLDGVTVAGADTCVQIGGGSTGVRLAHVIVRDCHTAGIAVAATGGAEIANATIVSSGTGLHATGTTTIKNSLLTANKIGLAADSAGALTTSYNGLFGNPTAYQGLGPGLGDLAASVAFADFAAHDLRLTSAQPSTDKGDPADEAGDEPAPNGGRVNLGAFGGTAEAETSAASTALAGSGPSPSPKADPKSDPKSDSTPGERPETPPPDGGCAVGRGSPLPWLVVGLFALLGYERARRRRR